MSDYVVNLAKAAKEASIKMALLDSTTKKKILLDCAEIIENNKELIKQENSKDIEKAIENNISKALIDRLLLDDKRIHSMSDSFRQLALQKDPIGTIDSGFKHQNGMTIEKKRVPLGVLAMIYESRPNVTCEASALAIQSSNAIILRGSASAIHSNTILAKLINQVTDLPKGCIGFVESEDRSYVDELITMKDYIDVLIPRGGKGLKEYIIHNATIPVIETGSGVCHAYIDEYCDHDMAKQLIINGKTQRPGVCNAIETIVVHKNQLEFAKEIASTLSSLHVEVRVDSKMKDTSYTIATDDDYGVEYLDLICSMKIVDSLDEAITFINTHSSKHSDMICSENYHHVERFLNEVDSAVVYANASTRFSDGGEFGFGGEVGISTQKLHARGPMGANDLTTTKYVVRGNGQVR